MELEQGSGAFTDYFVCVAATNPRQIQAIADEVEDRLEKKGMRPAAHRGLPSRRSGCCSTMSTSWYIVFSEKARKFYDLERLWKSAKKLEPS